MSLNLEDLQPQEAEFELSAYKGVKFTLRPFSLRSRIWLGKRFTQDQIKGIFEEQRMEEISELVFFQLKDKSVLKSVEDLQDAVQTQSDRIAMMQAMLTTIGISQPVIEQLAKRELEKNEASLSQNQPTGAQSTTP
jgi:hypothetical protein